MERIERNELQPAVIYVSPDGSDANAGTLTRPVKTPKEALARMRAGGSDDGGRIVLRGGNYYDVALTLDAGDAGLTIEAYPGERPVLYGGIPVTGWKREGEWLVAELDGVRDRSRDFRLIEAGGEARQRARLPEAGAFAHLNEFRVDWMSTFGGGWRRQPTEEELTRLKVRPEDVGPWLDADNAELTVYHEWDESLVGVKTYDAASGMLHLANQPGHPPGAFADRNDNALKYVLWNVREGMTRPGQWYLDRTNGRLVYWPLPSETPDKLHLVAPSRETVLRLQPGAERLTFRGLTIACAAARLAAGGFGALEAEAAIAGEDIADVAFEDVTVRNTSGWACKLEGRRIRLSGCHFHHTGAGGVHFKGEGVMLERTRIHDIGLTYGSAVAVSSQGSGNIIRRNEIHDTPYCGIISTSPHTAVYANLLYDTMTFMKDGGAIYIAWHSTHVTVSGNAVFSRAKERVRRYAYYLDEKCADCAVENNLAVNLGVPMLSHMTTGCSFTNNIFLDDGPQVISVLNSWGVAFERNIAVARSIDIHSPQGNPAGLPSEFDSHDYLKTFSASDGIVSLSNNLFHAADGKVVFKEYVHYKPVRETPLEGDNGNVFAEPLFAEPAAGDFFFAADSSAWALGIRPLSFAEAGCGGRFAEVFAAFCGHGREDETETDEPAGLSGTQKSGRNAADER